jgi:hypothetical protein
MVRDKAVNVLYVEMADSAMVFRVRWWIESNRDQKGLTPPEICPKMHSPGRPCALCTTGAGQGP